VKYPERYSLKSDGERITEAQNLNKLMAAIPGRKVKRELAKNIASTLLGGKVSVDDLEEIHREIDGANYTTSDPAAIVQAVQAGVCGEKTASVALGFDDKEYLEARTDHTARIARIAESQGVLNGRSDPAAKGVVDLSADPNAGKAEKAASRNTDLQPTTAPNVRGEGQPKLN